MLPSSEQSAAGYRALRTRIIATLEPLTDHNLFRPVPACPGWTVTELVAHFVGVAEDVAALNLDGVASKAWTDAQVQRATGRSLSQMLEAWRTDGEQVDQLVLAAPPAAGAQLVFDTTTHEQDLYSALGRTEARDHEELRLALAFIVNSLDGVVRGQGLPTIEVRTDMERWVLGDGEPMTRIVGSRYELVRALAGRRTREELDGLVERGDLGPYLVLFGPDSPIRPPERSLGE